MNGFTFYLDYYNLIDTLPNEKDKKELYEAILDYMFKDNEPKLNGHNQAIFNTLKHQLDVSKNNSGRGGRTNQKQIKTKEKTNQIKADLKPNDNRLKTDLITDCKTDYKTDYKTDRHNKTSISNFLFLFSNLYISNLDNKDKIYNLFKEYLEIRNKKKYIVNETIVNRLINKLNNYGTTDEQKIKIIENAINGSWKDFYELNDKEKTDVLPKWVGKENNVAMATEEEINELNELMKEVMK